jgi:glycolate oxidase
MHLGRARRTEGLAKRLRDIFGGERVAHDPLERLLYSHDMAPMPASMLLPYRVVPDAVVRPADAAQLSELMKLANELVFPVVPRGAATWGLGGAVPCMGGVVVDLTSMNRVIDVDSSKRIITVEAGTTWQSASEAARRKGLLLPIYPSSYMSATVGGWLAVGGVGIGNYKYGRIPENIVSIEAVFPNGKIMALDYHKTEDGKPNRLGGWPFVGTEGIFGIITKVTLKCHPYPEKILPLSFSIDTLEKAGPLLRRLAESGIVPWHVMFSDEANYELLRRAGIDTGVISPLVTMFLEGKEKNVLQDAETLKKLASGCGAVEASPKVAQREYEERGYEFRMRSMGVSSLPAELLVPIDKFETVLRECRHLMTKMKLDGAVIGTLVDREKAMLMPYYLLDERNEMDMLSSMTFNPRAADIAFKHGGRPVGIGLYFSFKADKVHDKDEMFKLRKNKKDADPQNIMNPGKLVGGRTRFGTW